MSIYVIATRSTMGRVIHDADTDETRAREAARLRAEGLADDCGGTVEREQIPATKQARAMVPTVEVYHVKGGGLWVDVELYRINKETNG